MLIKLASKKLEFKLGGTTLSVDINDAIELKKEIEDIKKIASIVEHDLSDIIPETVVVKSDLASIFSTDGRLLFFNDRIPNQRNEKVMLAIYGYGVKGATVRQIEATTGVTNVRNNVINSGNNKHYFRRLGKNRFVLSKDGEDEVRERILPKLR